MFISTTVPAQGCESSEWLLAVQFKIVKAGRVITGSSNTSSSTGNSLVTQQKPSALGFAFSQPRSSGSWLN